MRNNIVHFDAMRGCSWRRIITIKDENEIPINLTGYDAELQIRLTPSASAIISMTVGNGITITAAEGKLDLLLDDSDTLVPVGRYQYDLKLTNASNQSIILITGHFIIQQSITQ